MRFHLRLPLAVLSLTVLALAISPARAGVHLWRVTEVFSNADGTVQFVEMATCCGSTGEVFLSGQHLNSSSGGDFMFPANLSGSTLNKRILLGTSAFAALYAALPGNPAPDHIIPSNFIPIGGGTVSFSVYDTMTFGALPTDGTTSLNKNQEDTTDTVFSATNSPTNFNGNTGSISAVSGPPGVPGLLVSGPSIDGSSMQVAFDATSCNNGSDHHILYGQRSGLPTSPGGPFTLLGGVCAIGNPSPYLWSGVPRSDDGSGLIWFLVVATDARGVEGSWGTDSRGVERAGPGNGGASNACAVVKSFQNACGVTP